MGKKTMNRARVISKESGGYTLIELIVALGLIGVILSLSSYYFLGGTRQMVKRLKGSESFQRQVLMQMEVEKTLQQNPQSCRFGKIQFGPEAPGSMESLRTKYPEILELKFECYELDPEKGKLVDWKNRQYPDLIEYEGVWNNNSKNIPFLGSVLK